jgi:hypothetical protein
VGGRKASNKKKKGKKKNKPAKEAEIHTIIYQALHAKDEQISPSKLRVNLNTNEVIKPPIKKNVHLLVFRTGVRIHQQKINPPK